MKQLVALSQAGVIPQSHIATLMELPDLQSGYNLANNAFNSVYTFIDNVLVSGILPDKIPVYLPKNKGGLLETEIVNTMLSLSIKPEINAKEISLLQQLFSKVQEEQVNSSTNAEMFAIQTLNQELTAAMPQIQQQVTNAATQTMLGGMQ